MSSHRARLIVLLLIALTAGGCGASAPVTVRMLDEAAIRDARNIEIRLFDTALVQSYDRRDALARRMVTQLCDDLRALGVAADTAATPQDSASADLVLEGRFTIIEKGSSAGRILFGTGKATVAVEAILKSRSGEAIAVLTKSRTSAGGPIGAGGLAAGSSDAIFRSSVDAIAREISKSINDCVKDSSAGQPARRAD